MSIISEERVSDSPYVATITLGRTTSDGSSLRPAEIHWHMVFVRYQGNVKLLVVGPWTSSGVVSYLEGAEILWVKFQPGTFMPHLPTQNSCSKAHLFLIRSTRRAISINRISPGR